MSTTVIIAKEMIQASQESSGVFQKLNFNSTPEQQEIGCIFTCFAEPGFDIISLLVKLPVTNSKSTKSTSVDFFKSQQELVRRKTYFKIS